MEPHERIILACDVTSRIELATLAKDFGRNVGALKVGLETITSPHIGATEAIRTVHNQGARCFVDGKFDDIPNTVGRAAKNVSGQGVWAFNVHATAGAKAIRAAVENAGDSKVLGVTVLTSIDADECRSIFGDLPRIKVLQLAKTLLEQGAHGIICSPDEAETIRQHEELNGLLIVCPAIRPIWAPAKDQKRTMTPKEAVEAGVDYMVIGRPITEPPKDNFIGGDSQRALREIIMEARDAKPFVKKEVAS